MLSLRPMRNTSARQTRFLPLLSLFSWYDQTISIRSLFVSTKHDKQLVSCLSPVCTGCSRGIWTCLPWVSKYPLYQAVQDVLHRACAFCLLPLSLALDFLFFPSMYLLAEALFVFAYNSQYQGLIVYASILLTNNCNFVSTFCPHVGLNNLCPFGLPVIARVLAHAIPTGLRFPCLVFGYFEVFAARVSAIWC